MTPHPPRVARALAGRLLPASFREPVLGDWAEEFHTAIERQGPWRARFGYWLHLLSPDLFRLHRSARDLHPRSRGSDMSGSFHATARPSLATVLSDVRTAARSLARDRIFSVTAILILGLGLGVSTTVYSVIHGVLLEPLVYEDSEELVAIWGARANRTVERAPLTTWDLVHLRENSRTLAEVGAFYQQGGALQSDGPNTEVGFGWMTDNLLDIMGIQPMLGRGFTPEDVGQLLAILDYGIWRTRFGADSSIIGRTFRLSQYEWTVIGVLPPGDPLQLPHRGYLPEKTDVWAFVNIPAEDPDPNFAWMRFIGRLAPDATVDQAQDELTALAARARERFPSRQDTGFELDVVNLLDDFTTQSAGSLRLLAIGAAILLVIVFSNAANLMLLRGTMRRHVTALRAVLGASRWRVAQLVFVEGAILAAVGTAVALGVTWAVVTWLQAAPPPGLPRAENLAVDGPTLAFAAAAAFAATLIFGLIPGLAMSRHNLQGILRGQAAGGRPTRQVGMLVVAEVALSVALMVGAGLLVRTMGNVAAVDPGFETDNVLTFKVALPNQDMTTEEIAAVVTEIERRIEAFPAVRSVGFVNALPLAQEISDGPYAATIGELGVGQDGLQAQFRFVTPDYLTSIRARLVEGRHLTDQDRQTAIVIDRALARTLWPEASAVGRQLAANVFQRGDVMYTVVGVVEPLRQESLLEDGRATIYFSARYYTPLYMWAAVSMAGDPTSIVGPIRQFLPDVHADIAMSSVQTLNDWKAESSATTRWAMLVMIVFAVAAGLLSAIGLYGVLGHLVAARTREIGIRMALGARPARVVRLVLRSAAVLVGTGLFAGLVGALWLSQSLEGLLFGVSRLDPGSYLLALGALGLVAALAAGIPAIRATRVNPIATLKE